MGRAGWVDRGGHLDRLRVHHAGQRREDLLLDGQLRRPDGLGEHVCQRLGFLDVRQPAQLQQREAGQVPRPVRPPVHKLAELRQDPGVRADARGHGGEYEARLLEQNLDEVRLDGGEAEEEAEDGLAGGLRLHRHEGRLERSRI